jgi:hypothetical protein
MKKETKRKLIVGGIILGVIGAFFAIRAWKNLKPYIEVALDDLEFDTPADTPMHDGRA